MSSLWPRIEPLLARVEKPARYIGMERGARTPAHTPGTVSWLLVYPDTPHANIALPSVAGHFFPRLFEFFRGCLTTAGGAAP